MEPEAPDEPLHPSLRFGLDAYAPPEIAERVETEGISKATMSAAATLMLGIVGGGLIGLGAMVYNVIVGDPDLSDGAGRIVGGLFFASGYLMAISAGAQVFTTSNLVVMSWAARKITTRRLVHHWSLVLLGNALGAVGLVGAVLLAGQPDLHGGEVGLSAVETAAQKAGESFPAAFAKGVLGNLLIAMGVWLAMAGRSVTDKILAPLLPIAALPIANLEHCVGNLYYVPMGLLAALTSSELSAEAVGLWGSARNLIAVTAGNIVGGGVMVALVYHFIYRRRTHGEATS